MLPVIFRLPAPSIPEVTDSFERLTVGGESGSEIYSNNPVIQPRCQGQRVKTPLIWNGWYGSALIKLSNMKNYWYNYIYGALFPVYNG